MCSENANSTKALQCRPLVIVAKMPDS